MSQEATLSVLNIGTATLVKDVMDQHLRSLNENIRTYYASTVAHACEAFKEHKIDVVFCELSFTGGSAEEFIRKIGGLDITDNLYFILATGMDLTHAEALQKDLNVDQILPEPFSFQDVVESVTKALGKMQRNRDEWLDDLLEAKLAAKNSRFEEAKELFRDLLMNHNDNVPVLVEGGEFYLSDHEYKKASAVLKRALELDPHNLNAQGLLGRLIAKQGDLQQGIDYLKKAQKESPFNVGRANEIVDAYIESALEQIRGAIMVSETSELTNLNHLKLLFFRSKYTEIISIFDKRKRFFSGESLKCAEVIVAASKKLSGLR